MPASKMMLRANASKAKAGFFKAPRAFVRAPSHGAACGCSGCKPSFVAQAVKEAASKAASEAAAMAGSPDEMKYMSQRMSDVTKHFPSALSVDDFLMRAEVALCAHGIRGDNCITCLNLCRDESTGLFKTKVDNVFGTAFNINGLGGCLTCGRIGFGAGFSHAPTMDGAQRYVFFSFPHVGVSSEGVVGEIHRPGRSGASAACGALVGALGQFQADKSVMKAYAGGRFDKEDPEFAILKQRLAKRIAKEGADVDKMDLVAMTQLAERTITADLEEMVTDSVTKGEDYAVITGVHIHNWGNEGTGAPTMEWIAPATCYVVVGGKKTPITLNAVPALTPRQLAILQDAQMPSDLAAGFACGTTVVESKLTDPAMNGLRA